MRRVGRHRRAGVTGLLAVAAAALAGPAVGQEAPDLEARLAEIPAGPRVFQETWLLPREGEAAPTAAETEFAGRVAVFQAGPRERLEIHRVVGEGLADPVVVVSDGSRYHLVTRLGATPLAETEALGDPLVRMALAGPPGDAPDHRVVPAPGGGVTAVVLRHSRGTTFDADRAFALKEAQLEGGILGEGLASFSAAGNARLVAAAGPRGVDRVRTARGTVSVTPDPAAVTWMEEQGVTAVELERFRREARLPPYDLLPEEGR